jgi:hypothetical protein
MSYTYNPILQESLPLGSWRRLVKPGTAVLAYREGHGLVVMDGSLEAGRIWGWFRRPHQVYCVDTSPHPLEFPLHIPCDGDAMHFTARVYVSCRVRDPRVVVERRIDDAHRAVGPHVAGALHSLYRTYSMRQTRRAQEAASTSIHALIGVPLAGGAFELESGGVDVRVDDGAHHELRRTELLRLEGETKSVATQQELARLRALFDHYFNIMPEGDRHLLAALVAADQKTLPGVLTMLREDRKVTRDQAFGWLRVLLERDRLDDYDLDPVTRSLIDQLVGPQRTSLGPIAPTPAAITGDVIEQAEDERADSDGDPEDADLQEPPVSSRLKRRSRGNSQ